MPAWWQPSPYEGSARQAARQVNGGWAATGGWSQDSQRWDHNAAGKACASWSPSYEEQKPKAGVEDRRGSWGSTGSSSWGSWHSRHSRRWGCGQGGKRRKKAAQDASSTKQTIILGPGSKDHTCSSTHKHTLVFLHSLCRTPEDAKLYVPHLWAAGIDPAELRVVAPWAPLRAEKNRWRKVRSWFEYKTCHCWQGRPDKIDWNHLQTQRQRILRLLEEEQARLPKGGRLLLGGLSQGASLAMDVMLHAPAHLQIDSLWCARGMLQEESLWDLPYHTVAQRARECPILLYHGDDDAVIPLSLVRNSYLWLSQHHFQEEWCIERGGTHNCDSQSAPLAHTAGCCQEGKRQGPETHTCYRHKCGVKLGRQVWHSFPSLGLSCRR